MEQYAEAVWLCIVDDCSTELASDDSCMWCEECGASYELPDYGNRARLVTEDGND